METKPSVVPPVVPNEQVANGIDLTVSPVPKDAAPVPEVVPPPPPPQPDVLPQKDNIDSVLKVLDAPAKPAKMPLLTKLDCVKACQSLIPEFVDSGFTVPQMREIYHNRMENPLYQLPAPARPPVAAALHPPKSRVGSTAGATPCDPSRSCSAPVPTIAAPQQIVTPPIMASASGAGLFYLNFGLMTLVEHLAGPAFEARVGSIDGCAGVLAKRRDDLMPYYTTLAKQIVPTMSPTQDAMLAIMGANFMAITEAIKANHKQPTGSAPLDPETAKKLATQLPTPTRDETAKLVEEMRRKNNN